MARREELYGTTGIRVAATLRTLGVVVALAGAAWAPFNAHVAAALLLAGFAGSIAGQLGVGILGYRRAMSAPWPRVAPLTDDDWD